MRAAIAAIGFLVASPGFAATLIYDNATILLKQGGSVQVGATLYAPGLQTDGAGNITDNSYGGPSDVISPLFALRVGYPQDSWSQGLAGFALQFTPTDPSPLANLDLTIASSVHLVLGTLTAVPQISLPIVDWDGRTPLGTYLIDIGIYRVSTSGPCGLGFSGICSVSPRGYVPLPTFADAGDLTIVVTSETPLPGSLVLFGSGLAVAAAAIVRRRRRSSRGIV